MKALHKIFLLLGITLFLTTCDEREWDTLPYAVPQYAGEANITILDFIKKYESTNDTTLVRDNDIIAGYVTANDISGNVYKQLVIQDETAALLINIDQGGLYGDFPLGQKVFIECKGFYVGRTYGMFQMGAYYKSGNYDQIGRESWAIAKHKIHASGIPDIEAIKPDTVTANTFSKLSDPYNVAKLFYLEGVTFDDGGNKPYATEEEVRGNAVDRQVSFVKNTSNTVIVRNSAYANFAAETLPKDTVAIEGILSTYNGTPQYMLRAKRDVKSWEYVDLGEEGTGSKDAPWNIQFVLENKTSALSGWIEGYIVGTVAPGVTDGNPITSNDQIIFDAATGFMNNTVVLAASADERDYTKCVVINLPNGSDIRTQVNLMDNADNLGKSLKVSGKLEPAFGAAGLSISTGAASEFALEGESTDVKPGDGSKANPYSVASAMANQGAKDNTDYKWVKGYVVGIWEGKDENGTDLYPYNFAKFAPPFYTNTNILLADSPNETTKENTICIQLPSAMRNVLSPMTNASILRSAISIEGALELYNTMPGVKNPQNYETDTTPPEPQPGDEGVSKENPYSVATGISKQGESEAYWISGYIVGAVKSGVSSVQSASDIDFAAPFSSATNILIADSKMETDYTKCIAVNLPSGRPLRTEVNLQENPTNLGKKIVVKGILRTYFGLSGSRDNSGSDFVLEDSGTGPGPEPGTDILNLPFTDGNTGGFTAYNVTGAQEWTINSQYGYVMSGFADNASHVNEDWLISPAMNLNQVTSATLSFEHARGPAGSITVGIAEKYYTVWVSSNYTSGNPTSATWTEITGVVHGTTAWNYVSSGNLNIPASHLTSNARIAFKYLCTDAASATWEIKNLIVK